MSSTWRDWWQTQRAQKPEVKVKITDLHNLPDWEVESAIYRPDGKYYVVTGVTVFRDGSEVGNHPLVKPVTHPNGKVILPRNEYGEYVVQARWEPGLVSADDFERCAQTGETVPVHLTLGPQQASATRMERLKTNQPERYALFQNAKTVGIASDADRFLGKVNEVGVVEVKQTDLTLAEDERWFTDAELKEAAHEGFLNEHFLTAYGMARFM